MGLKNHVLLFFIIIANATGCIRAEFDSRDEVVEQVSKIKAVWDAPPKRTPANHSVDGPLLGNGDMGVCLGGPPEKLRFYLSKNDFWRLKSKAEQSGPRVFGYLDVVNESLKGASYHVEQSVFDGKTVTTLVKGDLTLRLTSWVAATDNLLVIELSTSVGNADMQIQFFPAKGGGTESHQGSEGALYWAHRKFVEDVDIPTESAAAMKVMGAEESTFTLSPDGPVTLVIAMTSGFKHDDPLAYVKNRLAKFGPEELAQVSQAHKDWWKEYWERSCVQIDDPVLEKAYYQSLYSMAAASRDPKFPPGIFGTWVTTDAPNWAGDYHLNYNHMAPFYAMYSANRIEQADPEDEPLLDFRERGRWYAENVTQTRGVLYPVGIGPVGIETTRDHGSYKEGENKELGGLFFYQRSNSAYCLVNIAQRWRCSYDPVYGKKVYPFVKEVVEFWEDYLKFKEGRYVIIGDAIHEGSGKNVNPILTLGLLRNTFDLVLDMSRELNVDAGRREKWRHILDHLSGWATQEKNGKTVFRYTEEGTAWWGDNTLGIQHIYPGNAIGLASDQKWIEVSHNTIEVMQRWLDFNGTNSIFPAAVRVGYAPQVILEKLREYATHTYPNGFQLDNPHGIENYSTVPNTINEMLCMSHIPAGSNPGGQLLRVFAVWPRDIDAKFVDIRAWGAFLVSSVLRDGEVQFVKLYSERGRDCAMVNPWPDKKVAVYREGKITQTLSGNRFTIKTNKDETLFLRPAK
jgi:alpha-L-fucosidase 2